LFQIKKPGTNVQGFFFCRGGRITCGDPVEGGIQKKKPSFAPLINGLFYLPQTSGNPGFVSNKKARH
jgi:hypothetical protein